MEIFTCDIEPFDIKKPKPDRDDVHLKDVRQVMSLLACIGGREAPYDDVQVGAFLEEEKAKDYFVARTEQGEIVGVAVLAPVEDSEGRQISLEGLAVNPFHRRKGIGSGLFIETIRRARGWQYDEMVLIVSAMLRGIAERAGAKTYTAGNGVVHATVDLRAKAA